MTDLAYLTAAELTVRYARRELSPVEVTRHVLAKLERLQPQFNAFVWVDAERALADALASEQRWQRDLALGPLDGVPVSVKDLLPAAGWPTRLGSKTTAATPSREDAPAVARLREAGVVLLGKTATSEFGLKGLGDSPLSGVTRNAWNPLHTPGGSSAGAVTAVALGLGAIAIGTDGGGSIRVPSAYSGVLGLKPTFGRVPTSPPTFVGVPAHVGPIARSVSDLAHALAVISRPDGRDPLQPPRLDDPRAYPRSLTGLRIGYSATLGYVEVEPQVARAFEQAVAQLRESGAQLTAADPGFTSPAKLQHRLFAARAAYTVRALDEQQRALLDPEVRAAAEEGAAQSSVDYLDAEAARIELVQTMARYHEHFDVLLTPTAAGPAVLAEAPAPARGSFAAPFSLTRQPALSIPCGVTQAGLPIGLQIVGRHFEDSTVLAVARSYELQRGFQRPPL